MRPSETENFGPVGTNSTAHGDLKLRGTSRTVESSRELCLFFNREPTDDELRQIDDAVRAALNGS